MRERARVKAQRLLVSGAVTIRLITDDLIVASVRGDTGMHAVIRDPGGWSCDCECRSRRCSHIQATRLVTVEMRPAITSPEVVLA
jgi:hypothetical protein